MVKRAASTTSAITSKVPSKVKKEMKVENEEMNVPILAAINSPPKPDADIKDIVVKKELVEEDEQNRGVKAEIESNSEEDEIEVPKAVVKKARKAKVNAAETKNKTKAKVQPTVDEEQNATGKKARKAKVDVIKAENEPEEDAKVAVKKARKAKVDAEAAIKAETTAGETKAPVKKTRKLKGKQSWPESLKAEYETTGKSVLEAVGCSQKFLGAHVSAAGGVENAIYNAMAIGCRSLALFLKNQRRWDSKPIEEESIEKWHAAVKETGFDLDMIVPHGSYLLNAGSPDEELRAKTKASILDEIRRCERLGIKLYNFHPGSSCGKCTAEESIEYTARVIDEVIEETNDVILLIETMAGQGNTIGGKFEELKSIIDHVKESNRHRVGVCLDTCHIFAAGYNITTAETYEKTMKEFEKVIGLENLKAVHVNDCKSKLNSHLDRHENIGKGNLKNCWKFFMNDSRFDNIPLILETPEGLYPYEMIELYGLEKKNKKK